MSATGSYPTGQASEAALVYKSPQFIMQPIRDASLEQAGKQMGSRHQLYAYQMEWRAMMKSLATGVHRAFHFTGVSTLNRSREEGRGFQYSYHHVILNEPDGQYWGLLGNASWMTDEYRLEWSLRDMLTMKHSSAVISVLASEGGQMLWQNASSMELYGCHGQHTNSGDEDGSVINFLDLILGPDVGSESIQAQMRSVTSNGGMFRMTVDVSNPVLRSLVRLTEGQEMHLDCQVTQTLDPQDLKKLFLVSQIDVTEAVVSQKKLELAHQRLESSLLALSKEKEKVDAMMLQQEDLIECLRWVSEVGRTAGTKARAAQLIDVVKRQLIGTDDNESITGSDTESLTILGKGGYGLVYLGKWRDLIVAVKSMTLPAELSVKDRRHAMALMELAISSSLLHANIVKTHSYSIKPLRDPLSSFASSSLSRLPSFSSTKSSPLSFQIQIIMEYCDLGDLREMLRALHSVQPPDYKVILDLALDIANGMLHLHRNNIIHADLKPANVLLKSSPETPKGFIAMVSDFGLSLSKDDALSSNISGFLHGTKSHMAPEILSGRGSHSNASDVYSFGILFFELITGTDAYANMFHLNFDEMVVEHNHRPTFPPSTPVKFKDLAAICWDQDPNARPSFEAIVATLAELRAEEEGETDPVDLTNLSNIQSLEELLVFSSNRGNGGGTSSDEQSTMQDRPPSLPPCETPGPHEKEFWEKVFNY